MPSHAPFQPSPPGRLERGDKPAIKGGRAVVLAVERLHPPDEPAGVASTTPKNLPL